MTLSEELIWRGFHAENTIKNPKILDEQPRKFYFGADPSADSLTIGNLAALMMVSTFVRHGYTPYLLVGGATGQIGDPKDNGERELKPLSEVEHNKACLAKQFKQIIRSDFTLVDNNDWFKDINYLDFLREVGKQFSMTQLLDREFVKNRIGEGGSGISYAEFSYSLIQGYDFLHLYRTHHIDLQLCGADQYGNCISGLHLIDRLENGKADVWSCPLVIDKVSGRKFGKSEGNAIWLSEEKTSVFDFYQFWLNLPDEGIDYYLKIYTALDKPTVEDLLARHSADPAARLAQKTLAYEVTKLIHGTKNADDIVVITTALFSNPDPTSLSDSALALLEKSIPTASKGSTILDVLVDTSLAPSKSAARELIKSGAITLNGKKISEDTKIEKTTLLKKGKNKFALIK